jgi:cytochrome P450
MLRGTLVSLIPSKEHAGRRKHFSKAFSQQNLLEWESVIKAKIAFRIAAMKSEKSAGKEVDVLKHFKTMATEVIVELCYGESTDAQQSAMRSTLVKGVRDELMLPQSDRVKNLPFYLRYLPLPVTRFIFKKLSPTMDTKPFKMLEKYHEGQKQTILSKALAENETGIEDALPWTIIVKEAIAFFVAGTDTTAVTAAYLIWAVLKHAKVHNRLKEECNGLEENFSIRDVQGLRYLGCVIQETLRLYGAVSTGLPRRTPKGGVQVGKAFVPEGTTVTTQSFTLHRNAEVFQDPFTQDSPSNL